MRLDRELFWAVAFSLMLAPGISFAQNGTTTTKPNNPSGQNELGGVGPIRPYGNDGLPSTSATFSANTTGPAGARARPATANRPSAVVQNSRSNIATSSGLRAPGPSPSARRALAVAAGRVRSK